MTTSDQSTTPKGSTEVRMTCQKCGAASVTHSVADAVAWDRSHDVWCSRALQVCTCGHGIRAHYAETEACQTCDNIHVCPLYTPVSV